jgi:hypothetical protein
MWRFRNTTDAARQRPAPQRERLLALTLGREVACVEASRDGSDLTVHVAGQLVWPREISLQDPVLAGKWLSEQLSAQGVQTRATLLQVPRSAVMIKQVELPQAPANERAALVALQAESRLPGSPEQHVYDYVSIPGQDRVTLISIPQATLAPQRALLAAAGLELVGITVREFDLIDPQSRGVELVIVLQGELAELTLFQDSCPVGGLTVPLAARSPKFVLGSSSERRSDGACQTEAIAAGLARLRASLPSDCQGQPIERVQVIGPSTRAVVPTAGAIGAAGADLQCDEGNPATQLLKTSLRARRHGCSTIDLANPRRPVDPALIRRRSRIRTALLALGFLVLAGWAGWSHLTDLDREIASLRRLDQDQTALLKRGQLALDTQAYVNEWQDQKVDWPQQLDQFLPLLPGNDRVVIHQLSLEQPRNEEPPVIRLQGQALDSSDVLQLHQRLLADEAGYELRPHGIEVNPRDPDYPATFEVEAALKTLTQKARQVTP